MNDTHTITAAQQPAATPQPPVQQSPMPNPGLPAPAFSGVVPTPPPQQQSAYPPYPQPAASGSINLNDIKPVGQGSVNFQDALSRIQGFASARGIPPPSSSTGTLLPLSTHDATSNMHRPTSSTTRPSPSRTPTNAAIEIAQPRSQLQPIS